MSGRVAFGRSGSSLSMSSQPADDDDAAVVVERVAIEVLGSG
jgi:hypothetical protein